MLGPVPRPAERREAPHQRRHGGVGGAGIKVGLHLRQRPVLGETPRAEVPGYERHLPRSGRLNLKSPAADDPALRNLELVAPAHQRASTLVALAGRLAQIIARTGTAMVS